MARTAEAAELGQRRFDASDFSGAIVIWTDAFAGLPDTPAYAAARTTLLVFVAHAHVQAFAIDRELQHLRTASALFSSYLNNLDPADSENRARVQAELDLINVALAEAEAEAAEREREAAEREDLGREQAAREAELERAAAANSDAARLQRSARVYTITGGSVLAVGLASAGVMAAGLALGADVDRRGEAAALDPSTPDSTYQDLLADGITFNRMALVTGILAGVAITTGVTLVAIGVSKRNRGNQDSRARLQPRLGTLELRF